MIHRRLECDPLRQGINWNVGYAPKPGRWFSIELLIWKYHLRFRWRKNMPNVFSARKEG